MLGTHVKGLGKPNPSISFHILPKGSGETIRRPLLTPVTWNLPEFDSWDPLPKDWWKAYLPAKIKQDRYSNRWVQYKPNLDYSTDEDDGWKETEKVRLRRRQRKERCGVTLVPRPGAMEDAYIKCEDESEAPESDIAECTMLVESVTTERTHNGVVVQVTNPKPMKVRLKSDSTDKGHKRERSLDTGKEDADRFNKRFKQVAKAAKQIKEELDPSRSPDAGRGADAGVKKCTYGDDKSHGIKRRVHIVGIAGCSGIGKSTLAHILRDKLKSPLHVYCLDDYAYRGDVVPGERDWNNPAAFAFDALKADLQVAKEKLMRADTTDIRIPTQKRAKCAFYSFVNIVT